MPCAGEANTTGDETRGSGESCTDGGVLGSGVTANGEGGTGIDEFEPVVMLGVVMFRLNSAGTGTLRA